MKNYKQILPNYHQYYSQKNPNPTLLLIKSGKYNKMLSIKFLEVLIDVGNCLISTEVIK